MRVARVVIVRPHHIRHGFDLYAMICFLSEDYRLSSCVYRWGGKSFRRAWSEKLIAVSTSFQKCLTSTRKIEIFQESIVILPRGLVGVKGANPYPWLVVRKFQRPRDNVHLKPTRIFLPLSSCMVGSKSNRLTSSFSYPCCRSPKR